MKLERYVWAILLVAAVGGCSIQTQIANDVASDAASAATLAKATGDTSVVQCYTDIGAIGSAVAAAAPVASAGASMDVGSVTMSMGVKPPKKLLTELEIKRAVGGILKDPNCQGLYLSLVNFALSSAIPGLGAVLP